MSNERKGHLYTLHNAPENFPTHRLPSKFWEELGRTTGTFGLLEEVLGRAIFALTGTTPLQDQDIPRALEKWKSTLEGALKDQLGTLIGSFEAAIRQHPSVNLKNPSDLITELREASRIRNVLCHGSWPPPDQSGASTPRFVNRQLLVWDRPIDSAYLVSVRTCVAELIIAVMNTVTEMGYQFPGSNGPGDVIWAAKPMAALL